MDFVRFALRPWAAFVERADLLSFDLFCFVCLLLYVCLFICLFLLDMEGKEKGKKPSGDTKGQK